MKTNISDLIDFTKVDPLLEGFNKLSGFVTAILDLEGNVLSKSGWRQICTDFHRIHPVASKNCAISDTILANKMSEGEKFHYYKCLNGLIDVAVPIIIKGEHVANLFSGQFFLEEPDSVFFKKQAEKYGFDVEKYMQSLKKVPVVSIEKVNAAMEFLLLMTNIISELAFQKQEQIELYKNIEEREQMMLSSQSIAHICTYSTNINLDNIAKSTWTCSPELYEIFGIDKTYPHTIKGWASFIHPDFRDEMVAYHEYVIKEKIRFEHEYKIIRINDGVERWVYGTGKLEFDENGNPIRMYGAIEDITERKNAEIAIKESETQYRNLANSGTALIWQSGIDKLCFYFNEPWLNFTGRTLEQEMGNGWAESVHPDDFDDCLSTYVSSFEKRIPFEMEYRMRRADGEYRWILDLGKPNYNSDGEFVGYIGHCFDVSERKKIEKTLAESERRFRELLSTVQMISVLIDLDGNITFCNDYLLSITGWKKEEVIGKNWFKTFLPLSVYETVLSIYKDAIENQNMAVHYENTIRTKDGNELIVSWNNTYFYDDKGNINGVASLGVDITEKAKAEKDLKESEERFALAIEASEHGIWDWNVETDEIFYSEQWKKQIGYTDNELKNEFNTWIEHLHPDDKEYCLNAVQSYLNNPVEHFMLEFRFRHKDGTYRWIHSKAASIKNHEGKVIRMFGSHTDITEQKKAERALKKSEEDFRNLIELSPVAMVIIHEWKTIYFNPSAIQLFGAKTKDELLNRHIFDFVHTDYKELAIENSKILSEKGYVEMQEQKYLKIDGSILDVETQAKSIKFNNESATLVVINDITERKKAEKALIESEEKYRVLLENSGIGIGVYDLEGRVIMFNQKALQNMGGKMEDYLGKSFIEIYGEEAGSIYLKRLQDAIKSDINLEYEDNFISKSGEYWFLSNYTKIKNSEGKIIAIQILSHDITERKKTDEALQASEEKFKKAFIVSPDSININRLGDGMYVSINNGFTRIMGYTEDDIIGKTSQEMNIWVDFNDRKKLIEGLKQDGIVENLVADFKSKDGKSITGMMSAIVIELNGEQNILSITRDVTELKKAEQKLIQSEEKLSTLFGSMTEIVVMYELVFNENGEAINYLITDCNKAFTEVTGIKKEDAVGKLASQLYETATPPYLNEYAEVCRTGTPHVFNTFLSQWKSISWFRQYHWVRISFRPSQPILHPTSKFTKLLRKKTKS